MKRTSSGLAALSLVGFYYLWRNRAQVQSYLSRFRSKGIGIQETAESRVSTHKAV
ncbi:MAG: hypothetical protein NDJ90_09920 [Oligoflexia bacterium]|nr:hypothetical protein [Oligoflexia bacterium]